MRYFIDTEFIEDGRTIDLISIGIVAEDGREFYAQFLRRPDDYRKASDWVARNVYPHLGHFDMAKQLRMCSARPNDTDLSGRCQDDGCPWRTYNALVRGIRDFCDPEQYGKPEFWGYYADYDWVALCQLFGTMTDLPKGWPMLAYDIKQLCDDLGNPALPEQGKGEHHALADARWNRQAWEFLMERALARSEGLG